MLVRVTSVRPATLLLPADCPLCVQGPPVGIVFRARLSCRLGGQPGPSRPPHPPTSQTPASRHSARVSPVGAYPISQPQPARNTYLKLGPVHGHARPMGAAPPAQVLLAAGCLDALMQGLGGVRGTCAPGISLRPGSPYSPPSPPPTRTPCLVSFSPARAQRRRGASQPHPDIQAHGRPHLSLLDRSRCCVR